MSRHSKIEDVSGETDVPGETKDILIRIREILVKTKELTLETSILVLFATGIVKVLSIELASFKDIFSVEELLHILPTILIWLVAVLLLLGLIYFFVFLLRRQTVKTTNLKREVTTAFIKALENSSFNPHRLEGANEQHSSPTTK